MRKLENQRTPKAYHKSPQNASPQRAESARSATSSREDRRQKALRAVPLEELLTHLELKHDDHTHCPFCQREDSLTFSENDCEFRCHSCRKNGTIAILVKKVKGLTDWQAIEYLESLGKARFCEQAREVVDTPPAR